MGIGEQRALFCMCCFAEARPALLLDSELIFFQVTSLWNERFYREFIDVFVKFVNEIMNNVY